MYQWHHFCFGLARGLARGLDLAIHFPGYSFVIAICRDCAKDRAEMARSEQGKRGAPIWQPHDHTKSTASMRFPPEAWWQWGNEMLGRNYRSTSEQQWRRWRQSYGTASPQVMSEIWDRCASDVPKSRPEHMLWAIIFLKTYATESDMCDKVRNPNRPDEKTFRHWAWKWIKAISAESSIIVSTNMHRLNFMHMCILCMYMCVTYKLYLYCSSDRMGEPEQRRRWERMPHVGQFRLSYRRAIAILEGVVFEETWWRGSEI